MKKFFFAMVISLSFILAYFSSAEIEGQSKQFAGDDWLALSKKERVETVTAFIEAARRKNVAIRKPAVFYSQNLDNFYNDHPNLKKEGVAAVLKTMMIMEDDWQVAGVNKDTIAKEWLGDDLYKKNRTRLGR